MHEPAEPINGCSRELPKPVLGCPSTEQPASPRGGWLGHTALVIGRRLAGSVACMSLIAFTACSSDSTHAVVPTEMGTVVVVEPTTVPLPNTVRKAWVGSQCLPRFSASPANRGVGRADFSLVPIAAVRIEVCTYVGPMIPNTLHGHVVLEGLDADGLENAANGLTGIDPFSGPRCEPGAAASVIVVVSDGQNVEQLEASLAGCHGVSNGYLSAAATPTWTAVFQRAVALADLCVRKFGESSNCVAAGP
jgi:hypothetical protein